jgi:hypothetical protein
MSKPEISVNLLTRRAVAPEATVIIGNMSKLKNLIKGMQIVRDFRLPLRWN